MDIMQSPICTEGRGRSSAELKMASDWGLTFSRLFCMALGVILLLLSCIWVCCGGVRGAEVGERERKKGYEERVLRREGRREKKSKEGRK